MAEFWNLIVQSNTFNFAILVIIIAVVFVKIDLPKIIEKIRNDAAFAIENAELEKKNAARELKTAKKNVKNTDSEVEEKLKNAEKSAGLLSDEIKKNTDIQLRQIKNNVLRVVQAEEKKLSTKLTQETISNSVKLAKEKILAKLAEDTHLHKKFIEDSIGELDKL